MFSYAYTEGHDYGLEPYRPENKSNPETLFNIVMDLEVLRRADRTISEGTNQPERHQSE